MKLCTTRAAVPALIGAALVALPLAAPAGAAPQPQDVVLSGISDAALSTTASGGLDTFYASGTDSLVHKTEGGRAVEDLGGSLRSGPAAITIGSEFAGTWAFGVGGDQAVWYRQFSDGRGTWGPWTSAGGASFDPPAVSCSGDASAQPVLYATGRDGALWRRQLPTGRWLSLGGRILFGPGVVPAEAGVCPSGGQDVFVLGSDLAVYENRPAASPRSAARPSSPRPSSGSRTAAPTCTWSASPITRSGRLPARRAARPARFSSIGGRLTGGPAAQLWKASATAPTLRVVTARGGDGRLWRATSPVGSAVWTWRPAPRSPRRPVPRRAAAHRFPAGRRWPFPGGPPLTVPRRPPGAAARGCPPHRPAAVHRIVRGCPPASSTGDGAVRRAPVGGRTVVHNGRPDACAARATAARLVPDEGRTRGTGSRARSAASGRSWPSATWSDAGLRIARPQLALRARAKSTSSRRDGDTLVFCEVKTRREPDSATRSRR